jgi:hypothetical protein
MGVESIGGLRTLAVNILGKFLANKYVFLGHIYKEMCSFFSFSSSFGPSVLPCSHTAFFFPFLKL